jgi:hypothetical protein
MRSGIPMIKMPNTLEQALVEAYKERYYLTMVPINFVCFATKGFLFNRRIEGTLSVVYNFEEATDVSNNR